ncbi:hypothetical protein [Kitasatospora sp. NPDC091207]|uniref:hypothetical protein n=1 Tax=Kitasatospora sp. NPDC091207 TaxID=3364083 RepID=UPI00381E7AD0
MGSVEDGDGPGLDQVLGDVEGRHTEQAAKDGARVVVASRSQERVDAAANTLPGDAEGRRIDVTDESSIAAFFADLDRRDLSEALGMVDSRSGNFLVISREDEPEVFIQAFRHGQDDWQVEYREGSSDRHFRAEENQSRDRTERLLREWMSADPAWRESTSWIKLDFSDEPDDEPDDEPEGEPDDEPEGEPDDEPEGEPNDEPEGEPDRPADTPRLVRIAREANNRTSTIGTYRGGQVFADVVSRPEP